MTVSNREGVWLLLAQVKVFELSVGARMKRL